MAFILGGVKILYFLSFRFETLLILNLCETKSKIIVIKVSLSHSNTGVDRKLEISVRKQSHKIVTVQY